MSKELIELALKILKCTQKQLAENLNVSPTQVSKWKRGEYMSADMQKTIENLLNLNGMDAKVVLMSGSVAEAKKWYALIQLLAESAREQAETGYDTVPLHDELSMLCWQTFDTLQNMGVQIPAQFPLELISAMEVINDLTSNEVSDDDLEIAYATIVKNPHSNLIYSLFKCLNDVYGFYAAYMLELVQDWTDEQLMALDGDIECCLLDLAATKLGSEEVTIAKEFPAFKHKTIQSYETWINQLKLYCFRANIPLRAELMDLVYETSDSLSVDAEREALSFNQGNFHPDIYMNELLTGMRTIHQVLPLILKKLEIYNDFQLDISTLKNRKNTSLLIFKYTLAITKHSIKGG